jgi:hypothetical protein
MGWELAYTACNVTAGLCWLPLFLAPRSALTRRWTATPLGPLLFAVAYAGLAVLMVTGDGDGGMDSLGSLRRGFGSDPVLLLAWVHYLSFDMAVGFWEVRDSARLGLNPWLVRVCLVFTFMLGPIGPLLYMGLRVACGHGLRFEPGEPPG